MLILLKRLYYNQTSKNLPIFIYNTQKDLKHILTLESDFKKNKIKLPTVKRDPQEDLFDIRSKPEEKKSQP
jgi:hypothetical protein